MKDNMKRAMIRPKAGIGFDDPFIKGSDYWYPRWTSGNHTRHKLQKKERRRARHNMKQQLKRDCADW